MSLRNKIDDDYKQSIKDKQQHKTNTLRLIKSAIKDKDISARSASNKEGISDSEILSLLLTLMNQLCHECHLVRTFLTHLMRHQWGLSILTC